MCAQLSQQLFDWCETHQRMDAQVAAHMYYERERTRKLSELRHSNHTENAYLYLVVAAH